MSQFIVETAKQWMQVVQDLNYGVLNDPYTAIEFIEGGKFFGDASGDYLDVTGNPLNRSMAVEKNDLRRRAFRNLGHWSAWGTPGSRRHPFRRRTSRRIGLRVLQAPGRRGRLQLQHL